MKVGCLGFIGMGGMGSRMAARLLAAGYDLTVYNRDRERTRPLERRGAKVAAGPEELAAHAEIILSSVADDVAVQEVMLSPSGALVGARPGTVFIEMSTVSPSLSRRMHGLAQEKGASLLDAPVSGTTTVAEQGQLVIFVGGDKAVYDRCLPVLQVLARETHYMGLAGSGAIMKLCANTLLGLGMQALAEAVAFGLKAGLPRERLLEVLGATAVVSQGLPLDPQYGDRPACRHARDRRRRAGQRGRVRAAVGRRSRRRLFFRGASHGADIEMKIWATRRP